MNEIITILAVGALAILNLLGFKVLDKTIRFEFSKLKRSIAKSNHLEHKKTRKESQEIKTRLAQVTKDLNTIEKATKTKKVK